MEFYSDIIDQEKSLSRPISPNTEERKRSRTYSALLSDKRSRINASISPPQVTAAIDSAAEGMVTPVPPTSPVVVHSSSSIPRPRQAAQERPSRKEIPSHTSTGSSSESGQSTDIAISDALVPNIDAHAPSAAPSPVDQDDSPSAIDTSQSSTLSLGSTTLDSPNNRLTSSLKSEPSQPDSAAISVAIDSQSEIPVSHILSSARDDRMVIKAHAPRRSHYTLPTL